MMKYLNRRAKVELQDVKAQITALKIEMGKLIELGASFKEIYKTSVKLDELIVTFHKNNYT